MKHPDVPVLSPCSSAADWLPRLVTCAAGAAARSQLPAADSQGVETARALGDQQKGMIQVTQVLVEVMGESWWIILITIDNYWDIDKMIYDIYIYIY